MKRFTMKRFTALALALIMTLSLCPVTAFAAMGEDDTHVCDDPGSYCLVCDVAEKINALPDVVSVDNAADVIEQIHAIDRIKYDLTDEQYDELLTLVDSENYAPTRYFAAIEAIKALDENASFYIAKSFLSEDGTVDASNATVQFKLTNMETSASQTLTMSTMPYQLGTLSSDVDFYSANADGNGWTYKYILPAGTYKLEEISDAGATIDGAPFVTESTSYSVNGEQAVSGTLATFTVAAGDNVVVTFDNVGPGSGSSPEARWGLATGANSDQAPADNAWVGSGTLADAMTYYANDLTSGTAYIQLLNDVETSTYLNFKSGYTTVLDLNGYTVARNNDDTAGSVITVNGTLTITGSGVITGGNNTSYGGGVYVNGGTFTMNGGTISGNIGGGVYVTGGTFTMNNGVISGNNRTHGGGVSLHNNSTFFMNDGSISENTAGEWGGGVYVYGKSTFTMKGGEISGNAATRGGGVFVYAPTSGVNSHPNTFTMNGGTISGNTAKSGTGGGVDGAMTVSGAPNISNNKKGSGASATENNVYLQSGKVITVNTLSPGASIGVTMADNVGTFTGGGSEYANSGYFFSDKAGYVVAADGDNLKLVSDANAVVITFNANGGSGSMSPQSIPKNTTAYLRANSFTREGYTFAGWNTKADGSGSKYNDMGIVSEAASMTLYAQWEKIHTHPNCGVVGCTADHGHDSVATWTKLTSDKLDANGNLTLTSGESYYLGEDITVNSTVTISGTMNLCLNGKTLALADGMTGSVISVANGATLNLCDCSNPSAGKITGGNVTTNGGGVNIGAGNTFVMYGGTISGNTAGGQGGGVYANGGTFKMNGGTISENTAVGGGGGVYGAFEVSGAPIISDNESGTGSFVKDDNAYLFDVKITVGTLTSGAKIGVTLATRTGTFTTGGADYVDSGYFTSDNDAYEVAVDGANLKLEAKTVDVTGVAVDPTSASITVGNTAQLTATVSPNNATNKTVTWSSDDGNIATVDSNGKVTAKSVGTATITATAGGKTATCTVTVNAKVVTPTILLSQASFTYNGGEQKPTVTVKDGSTELDPSTDYDITWPADCANVGTKTITVILKGNYSGNKTAEYAIVKADSSCEPPVAINDLVYTGSAQNLVNAATATGGEVQYSLSATGTFSDSIPTGTNAGAYKVYYKVIGDANHNDTAVLGPVQVKIAKQKVTMPTENTATFTYNGAAQTYMETASTLYEISNETQTNAGSYTVTVALKNTANYEWADGTTAALTFPFSIGKASLTITAKNHTITYGDAPANNGVDYTGFVNGETANVLGGTLDLGYSYTRYGNVGSYTITPKGLNSDNYDITFAPGTLTVEQKEIGIDWGNTALTYTGAALAPTAIATEKVNSDVISLTVDGAQTNVGSYTATVTGITGAKAENYKLPSIVTTSFTISAKALTSPTIELSQDSFTYDGTEKTPAVTVKDGTTPLTGGIDYDITWSADCKSAGTKTVTVTFKGNYSGTKTAEYSISYLTTPAEPYTISGAVKDSDGKYYAEGTVTLNAPAGYQISAAENGTFSEQISFDAASGKPANVYLKKIVDGTITNAIPVNEEFVFDGAAPVITGVVDGQDYYGATTIEVMDTNLASVTVDGNTVTLSDGKYTIQPDNGSHIIVVTDKAGNSTTVTINVYKKYTVTYKNGDATIDTQTVNHGANAIAPAIPTKAGYTGVWSNDGTNITSDRTITVVWTADRLSGTVTITGTAQFGAELTAIVTNSNNTGTLSYKWFRDGTEISGATGDKYTLTADDIGKKITCKVSSSEQKETIVSDETGIVVALTFGANAIVANGYSDVYDGNAHGITVTAPSGATVKYGTTAGEYAAGTSPTLTDVGNLTVYYQVTMTGYTAVTGSETITITKANQETFAITNKPSGSVAYGDNFTLGTSGGSGSGAVTWEITAGDTYAEIDNTGKVTIKGVGTVTITATKAASTNYKVATATYTFTTVKAALTVTAPTAVAGLVYTGSAQNLVNAATPTGGAVQYSLSATGTFSDSIPTGTNAGTYTVYYKVIGDANHNDTTVLGPVQVTIAKATQAAPTSVGKTDETVNNKNDGSITGVDSTMEYRKDGETTYNAIVGDKVENLSDGRYFVRYKEVDNYSASPDTEVTIAAGRVVNNGGYPGGYYPIVPPNETPEADPVAKPEVKPEVTPTTPPAEEVVTPESEDTTPEVVPEPPADDGAVDGTPGDDVSEEDNSGADVWIAISLFALVAIILLLIILIVRKKRKEEQ